MKSVTCVNEICSHVPDVFTFVPNIALLEEVPVAIERVVIAGIVTRATPKTSAGMVNCDFAVVPIA